MLEKKGGAMVACVHVAKILPGKNEEFRQRIKEFYEGNQEALRALGFHRISCFTTWEVSSEGDSLLVTVFEADDPSAVERFYSAEWVIQAERRNHGVLVAPHDHDDVPKNVAFLDLDLQF
jgi:DNA-directed RNA polymerase subunit N (RpoN/RPB10)